MRVAVIGLGSAGSRHARNLVALGHEVTGFDPTATADLPSVRRASSVVAAVADAEAVVIASPSAHHAEHALAALTEGKHVLVEKPLATTVSEAETVVDAAESAGVVCGVAMNLRFHPGVFELKRLVDAGTLGTIRLAQASFGYDLRLWRPGTDYRHAYSARSDLGGGIVFDAIHEIDYLLWLLGPVATVSAETAQVSDLEIDVEDVALAILRFEFGAVGTVDLNFFEPAYRRGCVLVGSEAVARWDSSSRSVALRRNGRADRLLDVRTDLTETYSAEINDFVEAVADGRDPRASAAEGLTAVRVADAIKRSAALGQRLAPE
jgi:predicted dehydrogenase